MAKVAIVADTTGPTVTGTTFDFEQAPQSITVTFNEDVSPTLTKSDFTITNLGAGTTVNAANYTLTQNAAARTATLTFATSAALPDADYQLTLPAGSVADAVGNPLAAAFTYDFFTLAGDANRDRAVNFQDLVILSQNYNLAGKTFSQGNVDYSTDGKVDFADLVILAQHYNMSLAALAVPLIATDSAKVAAKGKRTAAAILE
jgi:hypothetical protein